MPDEIKSIEVEGISITDAINKALKIFGVSRNQVETKVLSEENRGLFGMRGAKLARVRVTLKDNKPKID
ncbi:MAG: Jag N-terminal domain-containing protein [Candidatus Omnitrophota bacterium]